MIEFSKYKNVESLTYDSNHSIEYWVRKEFIEHGG